MRKEWEGRSVESALRYPEDVVIFAVGLMMFIVLHRFTKNQLSKYLIDRFSKKNVKEIPENKFNRALFKFVSFSFLLCWGVFSLYDQPWMLYPFGLTLEWEGNRTPWKINYYYVIEVVYYVGSMVTVFFEDRQSDFYLMIWHHVVTLLLIGFSYRYNFLRYGVFLMVLHDVSDPWMEAAKISVYLGYQNLGNALFAFFTLFFIIPRIFIYIYMVLYPGYYFLFEYGSKILVPIWCLLISVFLLNLYWASLIVTMLIDLVAKGKVERDIRDVQEKDFKNISEKGKRKIKSKK